MWQEETTVRYVCQEETLESEFVLGKDPRARVCVRVNDFIWVYASELFLDGWGYGSDLFKRNHNEKIFVKAMLYLSNVAHLHVCRLFPCAAVRSGSPTRIWFRMMDPASPVTWSSTQGTTHAWYCTLLTSQTAHVPSTWRTTTLSWISYSSGALTYINPNIRAPTPHSPKKKFYPISLIMWNKSLHDLFQCILLNR